IGFKRNSQVPVSERSIDGKAGNPSLRIGCYHPGDQRIGQSVIGHGAMIAISDMVDVQDLPLYLRASPETPEQAAASLSTGATLAEVERAYIIRVLREPSGVISAAATRLGMPRTTLNAMMTKLEISRKDL